MKNIVAIIPISLSIAILPLSAFCSETDSRQQATTVSEPTPAPVATPAIAQTAKTADRFIIKEIKFYGNISIQTAELQKALASLTGRNLSSKELEKSAIRIASLYSMRNITAKSFLSSFDAGAGRVSYQILESADSSKDPDFKTAAELFVVSSSEGSLHMDKVAADRIFSRPSTAAAPESKPIQAAAAKTAPAGPVSKEAAAVAPAAALVPMSGDVMIKADAMHHNQSDDTVIATGNVVIEWEGMVLTCDKATYARSTGIMTATSNVVITKGNDIIKGDRAEVQLEDKHGKLSNATIFGKQGNFHITGETISRVGENDYSAQNGTLTTCDDPVPAWKFSAEQLDVTMEEYGIGKKVLFYIKDVPVLYLPYVIFPVKKERQSGFLFPKFSYSAKKGFQADNFFYWAISPSQEATFELDVQTNRGIGNGLDYRYLRKQGSSGTLGGYLIYDTLQNRWRGQLAENHKEIFSPTMNLRTSINLTTDTAFLGDYGEKSGDYNRQSNDSSINFLKTWDNYALTGTMRYSQNYYTVNNSSTLQTLPEIGLAAVRQRLFNTPLYFDMDSTFSNFYREKGTSGQRLQSLPRLTLVSGLPGYLNLSAYGGAIFRGYNSNSMPADSGIKNTDGNILPDLGASLSTSLSRVYDINGEKLKKLRHEIIPEVSYRYTASRDQSRLPLYDYDDRLAHQNIVYYGITNLLGGKFQAGQKTEYIDLARVKIMQGYSINGGRRDLLTAVDTDRKLTDIILESDTTIHPNARLTLDARYNTYQNYVSSVTPGIELDDKQGTTIGTSYHMAHAEYKYIEGRVATKRFKPFTLNYSSRYSFDRSGFLESIYSVEYKHQCWSMIFGYNDRPGNRTFSISFNLGGLFGVGAAK